MMRVSACLIVLLAGCSTPNFAPSDLNFNAIDVASEQDAYDLLLNIAYSAAVADSLVDGCGSFGFEDTEVKFAYGFAEGKVEEFYANDAAGFDAFVLRMTGQSGVDLESSTELSQEVKADILARIPAYFDARNIVSAEDEASICAAADVEKKAGSLIGRFLFRSE